ncbi:hypothetical protein Tco_0278602 [Tanacetum coccineum]
MAAFWVVNNHFQKFIDSQFSLDYDSQMTDTYFVKYTGIEVKHFRDTLLQHMGNVKKSVAERTRHQRQYDRRVNKRQLQSGTESEVQDDSSRLGNDTDVDDADIRPIYDEEPVAEVQLTAECNIYAIGQQHTEKPEIINEGRVDQYPEQRQVKSHMLDSSPDNQTTDYSKQSLEWITYRMLFRSCTARNDSEPTLGSNVDISNIHESKQTLDLSAGTSINVQDEQSPDLSAELESLFGPLFDEYLNGENQVVLKSSAINTADASYKRQQQPDSTSSTSTLATSVTTDGNFDL